ncbi:MAG: DNA methyltransferase [Thermoplasmatota archaeon]
MKDAIKKVKEDEVETKKDNIIIPPEFKLIHGDFKKEWKKLEKDSIDFIITDPPYPKEYLPLYEELAKCASVVLKPGGSLLVMVGQSYLPEILEMMNKHISYHWILSYQTPGGQSTQLWDRKVNTFWKPILWFVKDEFKGDWIGDVIKSNTNDNDKRFHDWGQSESGMLDLMKRFVKPDDIVLDPFMGGCTTGIICTTLKSQFIGIEIDEKTFDSAKVRLGEYHD